ncbi:MAG TPA: Ig-like domain-containing protein, partial [Xanthobacteraceae bacterium]|nr:Ig-like domain-containing protein [Xanthobacteraceae bacterium]
MANDPNNPPDALDVAASANEDTSNPITVNASFTDPDVSDTHTFSIDTTGTTGSVVDNHDGTFSYDPNNQFETLAVGETAIDKFNYTVTDSQGASDTATVTVTINGENDPPVAHDVSKSTNEDTGNPITISADVTDVDTSDTHTFTIDTSATKGSVVNNLDGTFQYNPNGQFESLAVGESATDTFTYTADDGHGGTATATVTFTIQGENDAPTANPDTATTDEDTATDIAVAANDSDPDASDVLAVIGNDASSADGATITLNG